MIDLRHYVYVFVVDGVVRYIGKGSTSRLKQHMSIVRRIARLRAEGKKVKAEYFHNKLCKEWLAGAVVEPRILVDGLTESEAFDRERVEIEIADRSQLWNQKPGGSGGVVYDDRLRKKISDAAKRRYQDPRQRAQASLISSMYANSPEARAKRSKTQSQRFANGDPAMVKFHAAAHKPDVYRKRGQTLKKTLAARPELVRSKAKQSSDWWGVPENNASQRAKLSAAHARPEVKAKRRAYWDSPEGRANLKRAAQVSAAKKKAAAAARRLVA